MTTAEHGPTRHVLTTVKNILLSSWQDRWYYDVLYRLCLRDCVDLDAVKKNVVVKKCNYRRSKNAKHCALGFPSGSVGDEKKNCKIKKQSVCVFFIALVEPRTSSFNVPSTLGGGANATPTGIQFLWTK